MKRFYFHVHHNGEFVEDFQGREYETENAARIGAVKEAVKILVARVFGNQPVIGSLVEVMDEDGNVVGRLPILEVLK
jgi:hypothetical protein